MSDTATDLARGLVILFGSVLITLTFAAKYKHQDFLNRCILAVVIGAVVGLTFRCYIAPADVKAWHDLVMSNSPAYSSLQPIVFLFLYPYLYWPSGYFARVDYLFYYLDWTLLACLGPIVSTLVTTFFASHGHFSWRLLFYSAEDLAKHHLSLRDLYMTSACVSIIDPTPLLFTIGELNVPPSVSVTVLWESLMSPDIATHLVNRASRSEIKTDRLDMWTISELINPLEAVYKTIVPSILAGILVGFCLCALLRTRWLQTRPSWEAIFVLFCPFFAHAAVQALDLWPILSDLPCGIIMSVYGRCQISNEGLRQADNAVMQTTILIGTLYYLFISAYFMCFSNGLGVVLGVLIFFCSIIGRFATLLVCLPLSSFIRWTCIRFRRRVQDQDYAGGRINRMKLGLLLFGGQTRGGVWFAWYLKSSLFDQKEMIIDAVLMTWLLSQISFGLVPRKLYMWTGLPFGSESEAFVGDGSDYNPLWYEEVCFLRLAVKFHNKTLKRLFSVDSDYSSECESVIEPPWQAGNRWMGAASVLPRSMCSTEDQEGTMQSTMLNLASVGSASVLPLSTCSTDDQDRTMRSTALNPSDQTVIR